MDTSLLLPLAAFVIVQVGTPGPNNVMLLTSGANFGLARTVPHILGINLGLNALVWAAGLGLVAALHAVPSAGLVLKALAVCYFLWLAVRIARAAPPKDRDPTARPMSLLAAAGFQWVNPKAWAMALGAVGAYAPGSTLAAVGWVSAAFVLLAPPLNVIWTVAGTGLRRWLHSPARLRAFNWTMAALLVASLVPVLTHAL